MVNDYSGQWFELFAQEIPNAQTEREVAFIRRHLLPAMFPRLLDLCCGQGRHAAGLARGGHLVTAVDRDAHALAAARASSPAQVRFKQMDARNVGQLSQTFDGVICMWQSFGYFSESENLALLSDLCHTVRPGGRLVLDVYNADFFRAHGGTRRFERSGRPVVERKAMHGSRLRVELAYDDEAVSDTFDWQVWTPDELKETLTAIGWKTFVACRDFDEVLAPSPHHPRMQFVAERLSTAPGGDSARRGS